MWGRRSWGRTVWLIVSSGEAIAPAGGCRITITGGSWGKGSGGRDCVLLGWLQQEQGMDRDGKYVGKELHLKGESEGMG